MSYGWNGTDPVLLLYKVKNIVNTSSAWLLSTGLRKALPGYNLIMVILVLTRMGKYSGLHP
jgi:hypothetical protein